MPVLSNPKHERFAQELAKGKSQIDAYETAGYRPNPSAASRLSDDVKICERVSEIQERGAIRSEVTIASLTADLLELKDAGKSLGEAPGFQVARAAIMDIAKLNGLIIDKAQSEVNADIKSELTVKFV